MKNFKQMFDSLTARQLGGALGGMAIAGLVYMTAGQIDFANIKGYLVQPNQNISENAGTVSTNVKTLDDATMKRLARRAAAVEAQLASSSASAATEQVAVAETKEPVTYMNTNTQVSQYDRLALRNARVAELHAGAQTYQPNMQVITPEEAYKGKGQPVPVQPVIPTPAPEVIIKEVPVPTPPKTVIKEVPVPSAPVTVIKEIPVPQPPRVVEVPVYGKNLPDSGLGLNLLLVASLCGAAAVTRPDLRRRLIASCVRAS